MSGINDTAFHQVEQYQIAEKNKGDNPERYLSNEKGRS